MPNTIEAEDSCLSQGRVGQPEDEIPIIPSRLVDFQTEMIAERGRAAQLLNAERIQAAQLLNAERIQAAQLLNAEQRRAAQFEVDANALRNKLRAITLSTSWRLTEPIRRLVALIQRFARLVRRGRTLSAGPVTTSGIVRHIAQSNKHTDVSEGGAPWSISELSGRADSAEVTDMSEGGAPGSTSDLIGKPDSAEATDVSEGGATWSISELSGQADGPEAIESNPANRKLICVTHILPWPPYVKKAYVHHRILSWAAGAGWDIVLLVSPVAGEEPREDAIKGLAATYPNLVIISRDGSVLYRLSEGGSALAKLDGKVVAAPSDELPKREYNDNLSHMECTFAHDGLVAVLLALTEVLDPAAILVDHVLLTRALAVLPSGVRKLVRTCDVFSISEDAVKLGAPDGPSITREQAGRLLARADVIVAADADEKSILCDLAPGLAVISAGVSCDIRPSISVPVRNVILLAASDIPAHVKGAADFLRFAWPIVKRAVTDAELLVAGAICEKIESADPHIKRMGKVYDLVDLYAQAKAVINPAIAGSDIAIETLAAFANLRPIVAWPHGTDGIDPALRPLCHIATNWYDFATKVIAVLRDVSAINRIEMERDLISHLISPAHVYAELSTVLGRPKL